MSLRHVDQAATKPISRSVLALQVTIFMGLQFLVYFATIAWLPFFLASGGESASEAGWLLTLFQAVAFAIGLVAPGLLRRGRDQRALAAVGSLVTAFCILCLLAVPRFAGLWLALFGASFGVTYILAFALVGLRASDHTRAASLSMMSQATAYLIAAVGPVAFGWLHDLGLGWTLPMASLAAVATEQAVVGVRAGRQDLV